jgi:hypothetical protein
MTTRRTFLSSLAALAAGLLLPKTAGAQTPTLTGDYAVVRYFRCEGGKFVELSEAEWQLCDGVKFHLPAP